MARVFPASITVLAPATSANLGPGFDSLGLALQLYNRFMVEESGTDPYLPSIEIQGALGSDLSTGADNLFFRAFALLFERQQVPLPAVRIRMTIHIPPGCGLGSSATAVVGGLVATTNVEGKIHAIKTPFPDALRAIIFTPSFPMDTVAGRKLLPASYSKADVTFNTGRVALLLTALQSGRYELIGGAMPGRLHQPYRQALFPAMPDIIDAAIAAGAHGACLSGGGSSLIALASAHFQEILQAMQDTARQFGIRGTGKILRADQQGARVIKTARSRLRKEARARFDDQYYWPPARPNEEVSLE